MTSAPLRPRSPIDDLVDAYLDEYVALDPISATFLGIPGHDTELPDLSPDGLAQICTWTPTRRADLPARMP